MKAALCMLWGIALLMGGCATKVTGGWQAGDAVQLEYAGDPRQAYYLVDAARRPIAQARLNNGRLTFPLPTAQHLPACAAVVDGAGRSIASGDRALKLGVRSDYVNTLLERQRLAGQLSQETLKTRATEAEYSGASDRLRSNRAHAGGQCRQPPVRDMGPRPVARCGTFGECQRDGKLICYSKFVGAKGCGMVASEYSIPNIVSGPACAAVVADLAGHKYGLDDAFIDFLFGLADDTSAKLRRSENASDVFLGWIIAGVSGVMQFQQAEECTRNFVDRQFGPLQRWVQDSERSRTEPAQLLQACTRDVQMLAAAAPVLEAARPRLATLKEGVDKADTRLGALMRERRALEWCGS